MTYYLLVFVAGMAGSFHCIGMCGGFACALGRDTRGRAAGVARHLLYNCGRVATYAFLGIVAGSLGQMVSATAAHHVAPDLLSPLDGGQRILAIVAGLLMIVMALQLFGLLQRVHGVLAGFGGSAIVVAMRSLLGARGPGAPLALGVVNGFLPCPLVYAFAAQAASTGAALPGFLTMVAFGLGTFPAMLMMGGIGALLQPVWRQRGVRFAAVFILALGTLTIARGLLPLADHGLHLAHQGLSP
jgi:uncharacterized protein